ncbi:leucine-rich repeat and calponiny domain-containing protein 1 [Grus japonensis]|uniref:Leucine-rich repeat and calponiny domain-containing protein 1 n=1 Tax=Grus japonensis TaxID=30415 RepID=A0ABC9W3E3_GRUJA
MATLGGESQPFPAAVLAAATAGVGGGGGSGGSLGLQAPLNRGLERALEEAAHSGGLNLSGRKLKEFPRSAAALSHDLSDTVRAGTGEVGDKTIEYLTGCAIAILLHFENSEA